MDELEIKKYVDQLPLVIKTAVLGQEWHKRVGEIGQKYSLHLDQISSLEYEVMFVMIGMEPEEDLVSNIQKELNISEILATQVAEDVNVRVFQYILKLMEAQSAPKPERFEPRQETRDEKNTKISNKPSPAPIISQVSNLTSPLLSEIESMADKMPPDAYHAKEVPPPPNLPGMEEEVVEEKKLSDEVSFKAEMIENRDTRNEMRDVNKTETTTPTPVISHTSPLISQPLMADTKLSSVVKSEITPAKEETSADVSVGSPTSPSVGAIVKNYSADPYREPTE